MCPACLAAAAWAVAGTTSAGGLTVLVARTFRNRKQRKAAAIAASARTRDGRSRP